MFPCGPVIGSDPCEVIEAFRDKIMSNRVKLAEGRNLC